MPDPKPTTPTPAAPAAKKTDAEIRATYVEKVSKRTSTVLRAIAGVAKVPSKGSKPTDAETVCNALRKAIDTLQARLQSGAPAEPEFTLPE